MICQGRLFVLLFILILCSCAREKKAATGPVRWASFPIAIYTDSTIGNSTSALADFNDAMSFWEQKVGHRLFDYRGVFSGQAFAGTATNPQQGSVNAIFVQNPWPFSQSIAAQTTVFSSENVIQNSIIMVDPLITFCSGDCAFSSGTSQRKTFAHELGHFLGLNHSDDTANIMYPTVLPGGSLSDVQVELTTLRSLTQ